MFLRPLKVIHREDFAGSVNVRYNIIIASGITPSIKPYPQLMLTPKQKQILDYIKKYIKEKGYAPSLEDIRRRFKLFSRSTVHQHIEALRIKGYLNKIENQPRSIELNEKQRRSDLVAIPLLGTIAAGEPIEAIEIPDETITTSKEQIGDPSKHYALRVDGDSMIEEGIFDGDIVIVREEKTAENGQTVVAIIDNNEATLKKIYREKNQFRLQPANPTLFPIYRKEVEIRGIVVKIIRNLESQIKETSPLSKIINDAPFSRNAKRLASSTLNRQPKPFLQWVGGKRGMIEQCKNFIPKQFKTYYEPFLGGGAMFFYLQPAKAVLGDNNLELIKTYQGVKNDPERVIKILRELKIRHSKNLYIKIRDLDREINIFDELNDIEIAARMIYLNQTGFNALYRVNGNGQFNVPIGSSLNRSICDRETIRRASQALGNVKIVHGDFEKVLKGIEKDDFIYLDPPYFPISKYSDFNRYTKEKFHTEDQERLKETMDTLTRRGVKAMLSNSNCDFINNLYVDYKINKISSVRSLNCKKDKRGRVSELLITNY